MPDWMDRESTLADRLRRTRARLDDACRAAGRDPAQVTLLPVSKTFDAGVVAAAVALGLKRFGENRVQEIKQKSDALSTHDLAWVVIGPLQTNKAKDVARLASEVQTLDRIELAQALDHRLQHEGRAIDVLVQVKTSPEESKHGLAPNDLPELLDQLRAFDTLRLKGLMTIATHTEDEAEVRRCFAQLRGLRDGLAGRFELPRLSMGMSGDFALAIAEGSTEVRIGSAIFGERPRS